MSKPSPQAMQMGTPAGPGAGQSQPLLAPGQGADLEQVFANLTGVYVDQKVSMLEAISQGCCEARNEYKVRATDKNGPVLFHVYEDSGKWVRCFCAPLHNFKLQVEFNQQRTEPENRKVDYTFVRQGCCVKKCLCCFSCTPGCQDEITLHKGHVTGDDFEALDNLNPMYMARQATASESACKPRIYVTSAQHAAARIAGPAIISEEESPSDMNVEGPCLFGGCSELCFSSHFVGRTAKGVEMGEVSKLHPQSFGDVFKEMLTDSDRFQVSFATDATPSQKVEMFTAMFLAEFMFFEQDNGMCKFDPATKQCVLTCFQCYFYGCLCPCQIRLGSGGSGGGGS